MDGRSLLQLKENAPHPRHIFRILVVFRVKVADPSYSLPLMSRDVLIPFLNERLLGLPGRNICTKGLKKKS